MDEVASSLGISKRTIYENFRDKEDLLLSYLKQVCEDRKSSPRVIGALRQCCRGFLNIMEIHKPPRLPI